MLTLTEQDRLRLAGQQAAVSGLSLQLRHAYACSDPIVRMATLQLVIDEARAIPERDYLPLDLVVLLQELEHQALARLAKEPLW